MINELNCSQTIIIFSISHYHLTFNSVFPVYFSLYFDKKSFRRKTNLERILINFFFSLHNLETNGRIKEILRFSNFCVQHELVHPEIAVLKFTLNHGFYTYLLTFFFMSLANVNSILEGRIIQSHIRICS